MRYLDLFEDPSFPHWGRKIILEAVDRDPVDYLNVLEAIVEAAREDLEHLQATGERGWKRERERVGS